MSWLPLSIVLFLSQYWMVESLMKRLEWLFLRVFAWPKASRIQFTCIFVSKNNLNKGLGPPPPTSRMTSLHGKSTFLFLNTDIDLHTALPSSVTFYIYLLLPSHILPLDVNMPPLRGYSVVSISRSDQRASWPSYQPHNDDFIRTLSGYTLLVTQLVRWEQRKSVVSWAPRTNGAQHEPQPRWRKSYQKQSCKCWPRWSMLSTCRKR